MMEALACHPLGKIAYSQSRQQMVADLNYRYDQSPNAAFKASPRARCTFDPVPHIQMGMRPHATSSRNYMADKQG
jgi:hypothetical protein